MILQDASSRDRSKASDIYCHWPFFCLEKKSSGMIEYRWSMASIGSTKTSAIARRYSAQAGVSRIYKKVRTGN
jgi:hypothetical protein